MPEDGVSKILQAIARLETKMEAVIETQEDQEDRIRVLESKGGKKWDNLTAQVITIIVAVLIGLALGKII